MEKISITINGTKFDVIKEQTILEAAQTSGIYIPRLCTHPDLPPMKGMKPIESVFRGTSEFKNDPTSPSVQEHEGCQLCVVKIEGKNDFISSCNTPVEENMIIWTETQDILDFRREKLMHILSNHPHACLTCAQQEGCSREPCSTNVPVEERCCPKFGRCELQKVAEFIGIREDTPRYKPQVVQVLDAEPLFIRNYELCIGCTRCVRICRDVRGVDALSFVYSNGETIVGSIAPTLKESGCKFCGACVEVCPTGALSDKDILWAERESALVPCRDTCPLGADVPQYIRLIAEKRFDNAIAVIREKSPFPNVLGRICFHVCEETCRRSQLNDPIAICALKRFALENDSEVWKSKRQPISTKERKVAVVGSGPAGLTAAYFLAKVGYDLTVFEADSNVGGMMNLGIPKYRLPRTILQKDLDNIMALGVKIRTEHALGKHFTLDELISQGYDAIALTIGAPEAKKLTIEGIELEGVLWGMEFLKNVNMGREVRLKNRIVVIGGGNVAMDVALTALRVGAKSVKITCLESREEMPAHDWEIQEALDENIELNCSWGPKRILGKNGKVAEVELIGCTSVFDDKGNFNPTFDETRKRTIETDMVILAIGQNPDLSGLGTENQIEVSSTGFIKIKENYETTKPGVFAGGEVTKGPLSVVEVIEIGRQMARAIDRCLGGTGEIDDISIDKEAPDSWLGRDDDFIDKQRVPIPILSVEDRVKGFDEINLGYNEEMAIEEATRCLRCDLRLHISSVTFPPERWFELTEENIKNIPETEGALQILDENKQIIFIQGTPNLREALGIQFMNNLNARYFGYEEDPMYTKKESELLQQFMQEFGRMPAGNEDLDDDLF